MEELSRQELEAEIARLRANEERFRTILDEVEMAFAIVEVKFDENDRPIDYRFNEANPAFERQSGVNLRGKWVTEFAPDLEDFWFQTYGRVAWTGESINFENYANTFDRWFDVRAIRVGDPADRQIAIFFNDVTERKRAEGQLVELNGSLEQQVQDRTSELNLLWTTSPDLLLVIGFDGTLLRVNPAWTAMLGYQADELVGHHVNEFVLPEDHIRTVDANEQAASGQARIINRYRHKDGSTRWISWLAAPAGNVTYAIGRDITEERNQAATLARTQDALRQAQKMEAIGQLTGGVAHDFNNLLQVVAGNLQLLSKDVAGNDRAERRVSNALAGVSRGAKLASQLLAFGRRQALEPKVINLGRFLVSMEDLLRRSIGEAIEVETISSGGLWNTFVDPTQVENAILNLAINSRDAMDGTGKLTIEVGNAVLDQEYARSHDEVKPGQYVMIAVSDTGSGMSPELLEKVFEPFFSTKAEGKGSGLGLSMVYGFVKQSEGHVKIYSEVGHGTTVRIYLPRAMADEDREVVMQTGPVVGGNETILVVEDDEEVRATVVETLGDLGYRVLTARDAQAGLTVVESGIPIDVIFTDVVMPGPLKSREMARRAKERLPKVVILFTSGYTENSIVHGGKLDAGVELLSKPYTREALARRLRHLLNNQEQIEQATTPKATQSVAAPTENVHALSVLLVEDDALIRVNTAEMLADMGHAVLEAGTACEALSMLSKGGIDILVTDLGLPDLTGGELALKARAVDPKLGIVFATGDNVAPVEIENAVLLTKPYNEEALRRAILMASEASERLEIG